MLPTWVVQPDPDPELSILDQFDQPSEEHL